MHRAKYFSAVTERRRTHCNSSLKDISCNNSLKDTGFYLVRHSPKKGQYPGMCIYCMSSYYYCRLWRTASSYRNRGRLACNRAAGRHYCLYRQFPGRQDKTTGADADQSVVRLSRAGWRMFSLPQAQDPDLRVRLGSRHRCLLDAGEPYH